MKFDFVDYSSPMALLIKSLRNKAEPATKDEPHRICVCSTTPCSCSRIATAPFCYPQNWSETFTKSWPALLAQQSEFFYASALKPVEQADVAAYRSSRPRRKKHATPARPVSSPPSSTSSSSSSHELASGCNNNNTIDLNRNDMTVTSRSDGDDTARTRSKATIVKTKITRKFQCELCHKSFDYKHVLMNHQRTHTGEKPYKCAICDKAFTRDHHLKTHTRLHTGEKPFKCPICDKEFVQVANLRRHERVHTGERPYGCDSEGCALRFSDSNQLKAHKMTHTRERPFGCALCDQRYRRKHHLRDHKCKVGREVGAVKGGAINLDETEAESGGCSSGNSSYDYEKDERDQYPLDLSVGKELAI